MIIANGLIFTENYEFKKGNIEIENGHIVKISFDTISESEKSNESAGIDNPSDYFDAKGCYIIPGLIDLHLHGAMGCDLCDATISSIRTIAEYERSQGITTICPATMSLPLEKVSSIINSVKDFIAFYGSNNSNRTATIAGINMEGPFINPAKCGAQNKDYICSPDINDFEQLISKSDNLIKIVDIAPELDGAKELIEKYRDKVRISLAHSLADYDTAKDAFESGICQVTHLGNAMEPITSRMPGPIVAAMENESVMVELIADGIHIHPAMVRLIYKIFGDDSIILISDSMEATGLDDGEYELGGQKVTVKGKLAYLSESAYIAQNSAETATCENETETIKSTNEPVIAGSVSSLMDCVKTAAFQMHIPLESAIKCATANPAKALGIFAETGSLSIGKRADIVILNKELDVLKVF